jgi:hypothetical protein
MYKGWAMKSGPCIATFNDLLCLKDVVGSGRGLNCIKYTAPLFDWRD